MDIRRYFDNNDRPATPDKIQMEYNGQQWVALSGVRGVKTGAVVPPKGSVARQKMRQMNATIYDPKKHR